MYIFLLSDVCVNDELFSVLSNEGSWYFIAYFRWHSICHIKQLSFIF